MSKRELETAHGRVALPAYLPVTTFGGRYPLDELVRPYVRRLAPGLMVSYHYARQMKPTERPPLPLFVDSGGFVSLRSQARVVAEGELGVIEVIRDEGEVERIHPRDVLALQERLADVAFTLDFPISPQASPEEAAQRQRLTIANALWALQARQRPEMLLFASVQGWDEGSVRRCARAYVGAGFDGVALGGLVPRVRDRALVLAMVRAVREEIESLPLHVFGLGHPDLLPALYEAGVDSVDSSSFVQYAAEGKHWRAPGERNHDPSLTERLGLALENLEMATGLVR